jgi:hypothetical protein
LRKEFPEYQKPISETDICNICQAGENLERLYNRELKKKVDDIHQNCDEADCSRDENCLCEQNQAEETKKELKELRARFLEPLKLLKLHRETKEHQRAQFNKQRSELAENSAILIVDFKENISLSEKRKETSKDYYGKPQRTLFGAVLLHREGGKEKIHYFDVMSRDLTHDGYFVKKALSQILKHPIFVQKSFNHLSIWSDNAAHFKNKISFLFLHQLRFADSVSASVKSCEWNFFGPNHGKSLADSRFAAITKYYSSWKNRDMTCTNIREFFHMIQTREAEIKQQNKKQESSSTQIKLSCERPNQGRSLPHFKVEETRAWLHFSPSDDGGMMTSFWTGQEGVYHPQGFGQARYTGVLKLGFKRRQEGEEEWRKAFNSVRDVEIVRKKYKETEEVLASSDSVMVELHQTHTTKNTKSPNRKSSSRTNKTIHTSPRKRKATKTPTKPSKASKKIEEVAVLSRRSSKRKTTVLSRRSSKRKAMPDQELSNSAKKPKTSST